MQQVIDPGTASIRPRRAVAGSYETVVFTYTAGHPVDDSGAVKIVFRFAGDFGQPQFGDPGAPNYCRVTTSGDCVIEPRWDVKGHTRPFGFALYLKVTKGFLDRGQRIEVIFGDRSRGSEGWRVQTFREDTFEFQVHVDPIATYEFKPLDASPELKIVAGPPVKAVCVAPSQVEAGQAFDYFLKLEDAWGNPVRKPRRLRGRLSSAGIHTVRGRDARTKLSATSNPIEVCGEPVAARRYWADFHGQSEETIGTNTIDDYLAFARDFGLVDIAGHQGNDFQISDALWKTINRKSRAYDAPGRFVTFPGYEWSANTPLGGDRNIYFEREGGRIVHSCTDLLPDKQTRYDLAMRADELFAKLAAQRGPRAFGFAHVGGRYADLRMHDAEVEVAVEVHAAWGTFEWLVDEALRRGYRIGICANSDGHKGRPGASYPGAKKFGSLGGLTCVVANRLDRRGVVEALRARHIYATTGHRPLLDVALTTDGGRQAMMGDVIEAAAGTLHVHVAGTDAIECVDIRNGLDGIRTIRPYATEDLGGRIKITWSGAEVRGRGRLSEWHGGLRVKGNRILAVEPINFWRPDQQPAQRGSNRVKWESCTTGGVAGLILTLARPRAGCIEFRSAQRNVNIDVGRIGRSPRAWTCGGLNKRIEMGRLPDDGPGRRARRIVDVSLPLRSLRKGDNPLYVRVTQEDGHMAWSSPIYVVHSG